MKIVTFLSDFAKFLSKSCKSNDFAYQKNAGFYLHLFYSLTTRSRKFLGTIYDFFASPRRIKEGMNVRFEILNFSREKNNSERNRLGQSHPIWPIRKKTISDPKLADYFSQPSEWLKFHLFINK
jgi:hypothetical protein